LNSYRSLIGKYLDQTQVLLFHNAHVHIHDAKHLIADKQWNNR